MEFTKKEIEVINELISVERKQLSSLNFSANKKEVDRLRVIAPLQFKLNEYIKHYEKS